MFFTWKTSLVIEFYVLLYDFLSSTFLKLFDCTCSSFILIDSFLQNFAFLASFCGNYTGPAVQYNFSYPKVNKLSQPLLFTETLFIEINFQSLIELFTDSYYCDDMVLVESITWFHPRVLHDYFRSLTNTSKIDISIKTFTWLLKTLKCGESVFSERYRVHWQLCFLWSFDLCHPYYFYISKFLILIIFLLKEEGPQGYINRFICGNNKQNADKYLISSWVRKYDQCQLRFRDCFIGMEM